MQKCKSCNNTIQSEIQLSCPNCGATYCDSCASKNMRICSKCYHDLEYLN